MVCRCHIAPREKLGKQQEADEQVERHRQLERGHDGPVFGRTRRAGLVPVRAIAAVGVGWNRNQDSDSAKAGRKTCVLLKLVSKPVVPKNFYEFLYSHLPVAVSA